MKRSCKAAVALALCLCLGAGSASAAMDQLSQTLSDYFGDQQALRFAAGFELKTLMPYSDDTITMLNNVLKHITVNARLGEDATDMALAADGESLFSLSEQTQSGQSRLTTSLLPNRTLTASGSPIEILFNESQLSQAASSEDATAADADESAAAAEPVAEDGGAKAVEGPAANGVFELSEAIAQSEGCYKALTDAIAPYAEEKKANYKIAGVGYAKWVRLARLTAEQSAEMLPQMIQLLGCGMDEAFKAQLATLTCKKGFTIALYRTQADGEDLAVYMKGNVSLGENDSRTLAYQWAFSRSETKQADTYKLDLSRSKSPAQRRLIEAEYTRSSDKGKLSLSQSSVITLKNASDTVVTTVKNTLSGKEADTGSTLTGTLSTAVTTTVKANGKSSTTTVTTEYAPKLTLTPSETGGVISGTIDVTEKTGKVTGKAYTIRFDEDPGSAPAPAANGGAAADTANGVTIAIDGSSLAQNADQLPAEDGAYSAYQVGQPPVGTNVYTPPASAQTIDLDSASEVDLDVLREEAYQNVAGCLLKALASLPGDDGLLLSDNMTDEDYAAFLSLLNDL